MWGVRPVHPLVSSPAQTNAKIETSSVSAKRSQAPSICWGLSPNEEALPSKMGSFLLVPPLKTTLFPKTGTLKNTT